MHYRECRRYEPCRRAWGYPPPENFKFGGFETLFSAACHEICLRKIDLQYENGKQLQVTNIKITESKETNPSTDLMCLAQQVQGEGGSFPPAPPLATALVGVGNEPENEVGMPIKVVLVWN